MAEWVPENERDTRWYLWNPKFLCKIPLIQTMSVEYLQHFGMPSSGDKVLDNIAANELVHRMFTINDIVEHHRLGHRVGVVRAEDTKTIYEYVSNHLNAWKQKLEQELNTRAAPIDDLVALDQLAVAVYKHARHQFTREYVDSVLARRISSTLRVSRDRILKPRAPEAVTINGIEEVKQEKLPEHDSLADLFLGKQARIQGAPRWR